jgi:mono/diheme cytochrome c family protein
MSAKFLAAIALAAFVLTSLAQQTNNPDVHATGLSQPATGAINNTNVHAASLSQPATGAINARTLFLRNCAHCHGADAHGDDGPDLHDLDLADDWIANRIRKGKAGQMTAFAGKLKPAEIAALVAYVQSLK